MGDGFVDQELADGTYRRVMEKAMENLFTEEPVKSLREYFDVFMINAVSEIMISVWGIKRHSVVSWQVETARQL